LMRPPALALIDGHIAPKLACATQCIIEGDAKSMSIAAASIIAKVTRDRIMVALDGLFPQYGFASHKGYGTPEHFEALARFGPCVHHRRSFAPVRVLLETGAAAA
jgi:ribonuclease HII